MLNSKYCYVLHGPHMPHGHAIMPLKLHSSDRIHLPDYLAACGAGFPGSQVAVVAVVRLTPTSWAACI